MKNYNKSNVNFSNYISVLLLKALLENKKINQPTYDKVIKIYKLKEVA